MDEAAEFGLREGLCVPIKRHNMSPSVVTMAGERPDITPPGRRRAHALARQLMRRASHLSTSRPPPAPSRPVTEREREMLNWMADGKTAWEIAQILGISEHTVITHQRNLRIKFDTTNNVHSVVEALRRHEIDI